MMKSEVKVGAEYAFRQDRSQRRNNPAPVQRVVVLEFVRSGRWRIEFVDSKTRHVQEVRSADLLCPWSEIQKVLGEEAKELRLREHNIASGWREKSPQHLALSTVFERCDEHYSELQGFYPTGTLTVREEAVKRLKVRAGLDPDQQSAFAYTDDSGWLQVPYLEALDLARALCAAEPKPFLADIEATEREYLQKTQLLGDDTKTTITREIAMDTLREYRPAWALIRQWTGAAANTQHETRIEKLERLVWDAIYALQRAGVDDEAARLRQALAPNKQESK
jgi:hypothetical protein